MKKYLGTPGRESIWKYIGHNCISQASTCFSEANKAFKERHMNSGLEVTDTNVIFKLGWLEKLLGEVKMV
jgi:hypothetical protein